VKEEPSSKRARTSSTAPAANAALLTMDLKSEFPSQRSTTRTNTLKSWMAQRK
jgi:hypothetical protein